MKTFTALSLQTLLAEHSAARERHTGAKKGRCCSGWSGRGCLRVARMWCSGCVQWGVS